MHPLLLPFLALAASAPALAEAPAEQSAGAAFSLEPIKLSSLMLNIHPDWSAWGIEAGVRLGDHLWLQSFLEYDKAGGLLESYLDDDSDFLISHTYLASLNTARWYFQPERSSGFVDVGFAWQRGRQQYLDVEREFHERSGYTLSPALLSGYEARFGRDLFFKVRGGGGWNAVRGGDIDGHLDLYLREEQARTYYSPHTHLTEVFFQSFFYIGDISLGIRFGRGGDDDESSQ